MPTRKYCFLFVAFFAGLIAKAQQPSFITDSLEQYIIQGMKDWNIPGLSVSILKDGKVVFMKGYGYADIKTKQPVDEETLFIIASNSKLFTGTALANLDHQKKLSLDEHVIKYDPAFRLYDSNVTRLVTVRDLLCHRLGLKTFHGDLANWNTKYSRQQIVHNMRLLKPVGAFRQDYGYSNSAFVEAGEILTKITGKSWSDYIQENILTPLGMTNTFPFIAGIEKRKNAARPYTDAFAGVLFEMPYDQIDNLGPAGGIVSSVKDMNRWIQMQLDSGRFDGKTILPWEVLKETRRVNTVISSEKNSFIPSNFVGYGLGVIASDYAGRQLYRHTGGVFGFLTSTCFVPEEKLGIIIMTNNDNQRFFELLRLQILDAYLGIPYINRSKALLPTHLADMERSKKKLADYRSRVGKKPPPMPLKNYEGTYVNAIDGSITITAQKDNMLKVYFNNHVNLSAKMQYMDNNEWLIVYDNMNYGFFSTTFEMTNGKVTALPLRVTDFVDYDTYVYKRK